MNAPPKSLPLIQSELRIATTVQHQRLEKPIAFFTADLTLSICPACRCEVCDPAERTEALVAAQATFEAVQRRLEQREVLK